MFFIQKISFRVRNQKVILKNMNLGDHPLQISQTNVEQKMQLSIFLAYVI